MQLLRSWGRRLIKLEVDAARQSFNASVDLVKVAIDVAIVVASEVDAPFGRCSCWRVQVGGWGSLRLSLMMSMQQSDRLNEVDAAKVDAAVNVLRSEVYASEGLCS